MNLATVLQLMAVYGPSIVPLIDKVRAAMKAGNENLQVTDEDWAELTRLSSQTAEDIYRRLGITPPPATGV